MKRINLLPPEERRRRGATGLPTLKSPIEILLISGAVLLVLMIGVYLFYLLKLGSERDAIAQVNSKIAQQEKRVAELSPYQSLRARMQAKQTIADGVWRTRFPWDEFLQGLAFVIPDATALNSMVAKASPISLQAATDRPLEPPGAVTFTGVALPNYQNVSDFIVRMNSLRFLANAKLVSAKLDRTTYAEPAITFEVAAQVVTRVGEDGKKVPIGGNEGGGP